MCACVYLCVYMLCVVCVHVCVFVYILCVVSVCACVCVFVYTCSVWCVCMCVFMCVCVNVQPLTPGGPPRAGGSRVREEYPPKNEEEEISPGSALFPWVQL